ncbi:hypothetical protein H310_10297 [Aphanomyces invadans]|uniref:VWFA domain-containing protein n=1 Tax=Aphanomyces invadans TaxID=157072 RepID=A0A024TR07_9STRA|nr:hypothetical protein H310_10297 [Aphanomyces invadans]ETV96595.1 hypothetical protein H310_10297 [Aphanomyces invadans]|eukprot:XP_008874858.1 hypothetical protein H310_10297 [Aphanomyces invadans]
MSRTKEAIMIVLDASVAMRSPLGEITRKVDVGSRFDAAKKAIQGIVNQLLLFRKNDEVGIVMYGTEGTDNQLNSDDGNNYKNVTVLSSIAPVTFDLAKQLQAMEAASVETPADVLDGIIVALDLVIRRTDNKKYDKRLVVITDAATPINNPSDMEVVCTMMQNLEVHLQIIGIDFGLDTKHEQPDGVKDEAVAASFIKSENEKMLHSIATEVQGEVQSVSKRMDFLAQSKLKPVLQTTKMRGNLEFGENLFIPVYVFGKVLEATIPSLQKESQVAKKSSTFAEDDVPGKVRMERSYFATAQPDDEVPPERRIKAYKYGSEMIPCSTADQAALKLLTTRGLKVLGFVDKSQWKHGLGMTGTDAVFGDFTKPKAQEALHALSTAMHNEGKFALARFVRAANAAPKIVVLFPNVEEPRLHCLWMQQLPFEEDLRPYEFPSLVTSPKIQPTAEQFAAADALVDQLSRPASTLHAFNPALQRLYDTIAQRAMDPNAPLAPLPPFVERYLREDRSLFEPALPAIQAFDRAFQLKEAATAKDNKKKSFWSDIKGDAKVAAAAKRGTDISAIPAESNDGGGDDDGDLDLDELLGEDVTEVGSMNPISDFEALLSTKQLAKSQLAVLGMELQILEFFRQDAVGYHSKGLECLRYFRRRSPEIHRTTLFNEFLHRLKSEFAPGDAPVWQLLVQHHVTLLSTRDDPSCDISPQAAENFLQPEDKVKQVVAAAAPAAAEDDEQDLFADLE